MFDFRLSKTNHAILALQLAATSDHTCPSELHTDDVYLDSRMRHRTWCHRETASNLGRLDRNISEQGPRPTKGAQFFYLQLPYSESGNVLFQETLHKGLKENGGFLHWTMANIHSDKLGMRMPLKKRSPHVFF